MEIKTLKGFKSFEEARDELVHLANLIKSTDMDAEHSGTILAMRLSSMKSITTLLGEYQKNIVKDIFKGSILETEEA